MSLGVAVIGTGAISEFHLAAYAANPEVRLVAVADLVPERAEARAAQYGAERWTDSVEDVLADASVDAVSVCTRNDSHAELAVAALRAGKHVLIEKPMARTVAEAQAIVDAQAASGRVVQVGYVRRWSPNARVLKSFVDAGRLGTPYYAKVTCMRRAGNPGGWFADVAVSGGGPLMDLGPHFIDIAWWLMGGPRVVAVSGFTSHRLGNRANIVNLSRWKTADYDPTADSVEDLAGGLVRFEGGAVLYLDIAYSLHGRDEVRVQLHGEKGGAELEPELKIVTEDLDTILDVTPVIDSLGFQIEPAFQAEIDGFVAAATGGGASAAPASHGLELARIVAGIYESAATGREVRFD